MKWFKEVFLKSIDSKLDEHPTTGIWITEKQVAICLKYMQPKSTSPTYFIIVGDYQYTLSIYKKGYGRIIKTDKRIAVR